MENKREFYKFWLGFFEKTLLVVLVSILVPYFIGQLKMPLAVTFIWSSISLLLVTIAFFLSWKLWNLKK
ncbi:MAG TPA: hypothetical protein VGA99_16110 [bacterium]